MDTIAEYSALIANRENMYRFLGRIFKIEADQTLLDQMEGMCFPEECQEEEISKGYRMIEKYLQQLGQDSLTDLAVDYARVFLGAGIVGHDAAYPYESVYTSPKRLIMQEARDQVLEIYRAKGLNKAESLEVPEDHIALELEFMAYLCYETKLALDKKDWPAVTVLLKEQFDFITKHLLNWTPEFCADIEKYAGTEFYKGVSKVTVSYLLMDLSILEEMIAETAA
jgi:anaerobic sulfite reductase subunit A